MKPFVMCVGNLDHLRAAGPGGPARTRASALLAILVAAIGAAQPILNLTATTDSVAGAPDSIRIDVFRWSTDAERDQLLAAWNLTAPVAPATGASGRGGGRGGGRAAALNPAPDPTPDPSAANGEASPPAAAAAAKGGGRGGRGGGRGGGRNATPAAPLTPEASLAAALGKAPIVGHLWSSEVAGYSLRYAAKIAEPDGGERIVLITDRRLGAWNDLWKPAAADATATNYAFSVIELRLNSKGEGQGKASLTGKVTVDSEARTLALESFSNLPVVLKNVKRGK